MTIMPFSAAFARRVMTTHELLARNPNPTEAEIRSALTNNVPRCTGYTNIIAAVAAAAQVMGRSETGGENER